MATANDQFREARYRTASLAHPEECLSRQELAELATAWIWDHHKKKDVIITASYLGKLEQGSIRWPCALYREALRAILGVSTDSALGFINSRRKIVKLDDNVKRRQLFETSAVGIGALALEELTELLEISEPAPIPHRVGATDIEHVRIATREFKSWRNAYGGGVVRDAVMAQLRYSAGLLWASCPDRLRPELFSAVGALAESAGYTALDAGAQAQARRVYHFGLACAEQAKNWNLRSKILSNMAKLEIGTGQPDEGLTLADQALVRADRLTPTVQALLHTDRALALATMRRVQETLKAIGIADQHFAHATPDNELSFMASYTDAHHACLTGRPLVDLAICASREPGEATTRLTVAAAGYPEGSVQNQKRAVCLANLATLTMATGDPLHAAALGHAALDIAGTIRSRRAVEELRELARYAAAHQHLDEVAHLRHRIATLVCTDNP